MLIKTYKSNNFGLICLNSIKISSSSNRSSTFSSNLKNKSSKFDDCLTNVPKFPHKDLITKVCKSFKEEKMRPKSPGHFFQKLCF